MSSYLNYTLYLGAVLALITAGYALLPPASAHPYPPEIATAITTLYSWLYSLNNIFPVDTLVTVLGYSIVLELIVSFFYPVIMWIIKRFSA